MNRYLFVIGSLLVLSGCVLYINDGTRAEHPVCEESYEIVYVPSVGLSGSMNIYQIGTGAVPIWCDVPQKYLPLLTESNVAQKRVAVCYSGPKPSWSELDLASSSNTSGVRVEKDKGPFSIHERLNPFSSVYVISLVMTPRDYSEFLVFYFNLYRSFCQKDGISCCMTGNGAAYNFSVLIEEPENIKRIARDLGLMFNYLYGPDTSYKNTGSMYNTFSSLIYDRCSLTRWHYDAFASKITEPELLLTKDTWSDYENRSFKVKINKIDLKLIEYQKLSPADKGWLESYLRTLSERF